MATIPNEMVKRWAEFTLLKIHERIKKLKVHDTGTLQASINAVVKETSKGDTQLIRFFHEFYGAFVEWGVGRGVSVKSKKEDYQYYKTLGNKGRRPRPWGGRILWYQEKRLAELASEETGKQFMRAFRKLEKKVKLFE